MKTHFPIILEYCLLVYIPCKCSSSIVVRNELLELISRFPFRIEMIDLIK